MSSPETHLHGQHHTNWTPILVIIGILIFAALAFIGLMLYLDHIQTVKDNSPGVQSQFNTGQPSQPAINKGNGGPISDEQCKANLITAKGQNPNWVPNINLPGTWTEATGCSEEQFGRLNKFIISDSVR